MHRALESLKSKRSVSSAVCPWANYSPSLSFTFLPKLFHALNETNNMKPEVCLEQSEFSIMVILLLSWHVATCSTYKPAQLSVSCICLCTHTCMHMLCPTSITCWHFPSALHCPRKKTGQTHSVPHFPLIPNHIATWILLLPLFWIFTNLLPQFLTTCLVFSV